MSKIVWLKRTEEWIKANPGKGTMYKAELNETVPSESIEVLVQPRRKKHKNDIATVDQGIYVIICDAEKFAYVGQSINMGTRMRNHKLCLSENNTNAVKTYIKMREHCKKHGIAAFEFKRHLNVENVEDLTIRENDTMYEYMSMGYKLYNSAIQGNLHCPEHIKELIVKVINKAANDACFINTLNELM